MTQELMWEAARVIWEGRKRAAWGKGADLMIGRAPWQSHASHPECHEDHLLALAEIKALVKHFDLSRPALSPPAEGGSDPVYADGGVSMPDDLCIFTATPTPAPVDWERVGPKLVEALDNCRLMSRQPEVQAVARAALAAAQPEGK